MSNRSMVGILAVSLTLGLSAGGANANLLDKAKKGVGKVVDKVKDGTSSVVDKAKGGVTSAWDSTKAFFTGDSFKSILSTAKKGLGSAFEKAKGLYDKGLAKAKSLIVDALQAALVKKLKAYYESHKEEIGKLKEKWVKVRDSSDGKALIKDILNAAAKKKVDSTFKANVRKLAAKLGLASQADCEPCKTGRRDAASPCSSFPTTAFTLTLNVGGGFIGGVQGAFGAAWDSKSVKGFGAVGGMVGAFGKVEGDISIAFYPYDLSQVPGWGLGWGGSAEYYAGVAFAMGWNINDDGSVPNTPSFSFGISGGIGAGVNFNVGYGWTFE